MTTTRDIVTGALKRARIVAIATGEAAAAEYAGHTLGTLNDMMHGWKSQGVDIRHVDLGISDAFWFAVPPKGITGDVIEAMSYQGTWNASTNTPTLTSGTGAAGQYYRVSTAGTTTLDDVTSWAADEIALFDGTDWLKGPSSRMYEMAVVDLLAVEICPDFNVEISRELREKAYQGWLQICSSYIVPNTATWDSTLYRTSSRRYQGIL